MGPADALSFHVEFEFQVVVTVVIVVAAWVAGWRFVRAVARRKAEADTPDRGEGGA